jgi:hypothetical protein
MGRRRAVGLDEEVGEVEDGFGIPRAEREAFEQAKLLLW